MFYLQICISRQVHRILIDALPAVLIDIIIPILSYPDDRMTFKAMVCIIITARMFAGMHGISQVAVAWACDTAHQILGTIGGKHCYG